MYKIVRKVKRNIMTKEELIEKIQEWEHGAGESFTDYFMHDNVKDNSWAFWLLGKGYTERANVIIDLILKGEDCLDQSLLYEIHSATIEDDYGTPLSPWPRELYEKDVELWAEFLTATEFYKQKVVEFFKENL